MNVYVIDTNMLPDTYDNVKLGEISDHQFLYLATRYGDMYSIEGYENLYKQDEHKSHVNIYARILE